jgi:hypothetical protein
MSVYRNVREPVWTTATQGCGKGGPSGASVSSGPRAILPTADFTPVYRNVPGAPHTDMITRALDLADSETTETLAGTNVPRIIKTPDTSYHATARMICNEQVEDAELDAMKRIAAVAFRP